MANVMSLLRPLLLDNVPSIQQSVREPFIFLNPYPYPPNPCPYPLHLYPYRLNPYPSPLHTYPGLLPKSVPLFHYPYPFPP